MAPPALRPHTAAVVARLQSAGLTVGNHQRPVGAAYPYVVLYLIGGGVTDGPIAAGDDHGNLLWQVSCFSDGPEGAQWAADVARTALSGHRLTVTGRSLSPLRLSMASGGVTRDDDVAPPVFMAIERYDCRSYPA